MHDAGPHAAGVRHVHALSGVAMRVGQVEEQRPVEVLHCQLVVADLGRHDGLHTRRQRRVAGGDRVVEIEVAPLLVHREAFGAQEHRQHHVGLLQHLMAVDDERVVVQQQREVFGWRRLPVPRFEFEELGVLRVDPQFFVEGDEHAVGGGVPVVELLELEAGLANQ